MIALRLVYHGRTEINSGIPKSGKTLDQKSGEVRESTAHIEQTGVRQGQHFAQDPKLDVLRFDAAVITSPRIVSVFSNQVVVIVSNPLEWIDRKSTRLNCSH